MFYVKRGIQMALSALLALGFLGFIAGVAWAEGKDTSREVAFAAGKQVLAYLGRQGVILKPPSDFGGTLVLSRIRPDQVPSLPGMGFVRNPLKIQGGPAEANRVDDLGKMSVVYFNLTHDQYDAWRRDHLAIYYSQAEQGKWRKLPVEQAYKVGRRAWRITAQFEGLGLYGLGEVR